MGSMGSVARQKKILELVRQTENISVATLVDGIDASAATVRRDLVQLEEAGKVLRVHGAVLDRRSLEGEPSFSVKRQRIPEVKRRIGRAVLDAIPSGASVFIDAGSTCLEAGLALLERGGHVVYTNSLPLLYNAGNFSSPVISIGGEARAISGALVGGLAQEWLRHLRFDFALIGASALDASSGVMTTELSEAGVKRLAIERARIAILAADSLKLDEVASVQFAEWSDFRMWFTDKELPMQRRKTLRQHQGLSIIQID